MNENESNKNLIRIIYHNRKAIVISAMLFAITALIITAFIPKKYEAMGVVYPTKSNLMVNVANDPDFGYQMHSDRLIQLFHSPKMRQTMVQRFDLFSYYEIDTLKPNWLYQIKKEFERDIQFNRTEYLSIEIYAQMKSPELASNVVNNMITYIDTIRRDIYLENTQLWVLDLEEKIIPIRDTVDLLLLAIFNHTEVGNSNVLSENSSILIDQRQKHAHALKGDIIIKNALKNNYSIALENLIAAYYMNLGVLNRLETDLILGREKLKMPFPKVYTVIKAEVNDKKIFPSYRINGLVGLICGLIFSILFFTIRKNIRALNEELSK
ncbi:MAG: LPS O-antigen subunit length determinant protein (WzzB/FepE family) [Salibacteraceae bacterium]|jgi:LPS O-antigen subunit length determinant protein (WzzB/FepE family)